MKNKLALTLLIISLLYIFQIESLHTRRGKRADDSANNSTSSTEKTNNSTNTSESDNTSSSSESETDINQVIKAKSKLEKTVKKLQQQLDELNFNSEALKRENNDMKMQLAQKKNNTNSNSNNNNNNKEENNADKSRGDPNSIKEALSHMREFQTLFQQMDLQNMEEKQLKEEFNEKMKDLTQSQMRVDQIYRDLKSTYKNRLDVLKNKVERMEKDEVSLRQKIQIIQKENDKVSMMRKEMTNGSAFIKKASLIEPECVNRGSCRTCLQNPKCIWCGKNNKCMLGDISGAYDGSCNSGEDFQFSSCEKKSFCNNFKTCTECLGNLSCGWCGELNMCLEGTYKSPIGVSCENSYFHQLAQGRCSAHSFLNSYVNA